MMSHRADDRLFSHIIIIIITITIIIIVSLPMVQRDHTTIKYCCFWPKLFGDFDDSNM